MSPRKRIRTSAADGASGSSVPAPGAPVPPLLTRELLPENGKPLLRQSPASSLAPSLAESSSSSNRYASLRDAKAKTRSWYGSWPRAPKSSASTQVAKETIQGGTLKPDAAADFSRYDKRRPESILEPLNASDVVTTPPTTQKDQKTEPPFSPSTTTPTIPLKRGPSTRTDKLEAPQQAAAQEAAACEAVEAPAASASLPTSTPSTSNTGWLYWLARSVPSTTPALADQDQPSEPPIYANSNTPDAAGALGPPQETHNSLKNEEPQKDESMPPPTQDIMITSDRPSTAGSIWSYFWVPRPTGGSAGGMATDVSKASQTEAESSDVVMEDAPSAAIPVPDASASQRGDAAITATKETLSAPAAPATASVGSTWAFWSRDSKSRPAAAAGKMSESPEQGEIAVIGERSEAHPKPATGVQVKEPASKSSTSIQNMSVNKNATAAGSLAATVAAANGKDKKDTLSKKKNKGSRPQSMDVDVLLSTPPVGLPKLPKSEGTLSKNETARAASLPKQVTGAAGVAGAAASGPDNLLLPSFRSTYRLKENPSILRQVAQLLLKTQQTPASHVFLVKDPPKIKKAVAIGVHGLFPAAYLRPMIGQPTGTSIRFANHGADAVRRWADSHGCEDCEIEKIALEGEGKIADRVENLWRLLLNWIEHIRNADFVMLACHSQGVPVGMMLLAKLISLGIITTARVGVCAMAGVSLGPFPDYKSGIGMLMGSAGELWDFGNPESEVSKRYEQALKTALEYGVRITYVGSIDDQVVPMESAIYSPLHHPYVYRAVFVDGRIHAPDFIANLVGVACKLRNLGVSDHGLIRELSVPLAGSLYSGEGHSRIYNDPQVYDLGVSHALETTDVGKVPCVIKKHEGMSNANPYILPWIMRGLLEEDFVKTELHTEITELVRRFDDWKPTTKALKDVKYRLEAVRSKL